MVDLETPTPSRVLLLTYSVRPIHSVAKTRLGHINIIIIIISLTPKALRQAVLLEIHYFIG